VLKNARDARTGAIIGAAMRVHRELGSGFLEPVYQEALATEFDERRITYSREPVVPVYYKGRSLPVSYRPDFICCESVVVELKALSRINRREESQIINYLKATRLGTGLLLNFGSSSLEYRRFANTRSNLR
jgi:GxxExxY protein